MSDAICTSPISVVERRAASAVDAAFRVARERLIRRAEIWGRRPLTRDLYGGYYQAIAAARSGVTGKDLEIGSGHGGFGAYRSETITSDIVPCPWLDCVVDATRLPFPDGALANIIMIDVLHHMETPVRVFDEAVRTLAPGGRVIMVEPYVSPVSWWAWKLFVDERCDMRADPFGAAEARHECVPRDPWKANIAIPTQVFFHRLAEFQSRFPQLDVVERRRLDMLVMPLSGGFEKPRLIPMWLVPWAKALERRLLRLQALLAFRCMVVLERT